MTHPVGEVRLPTRPGWAQVLYAQSGLFIARTPGESWIVPPHKAICAGEARIQVVTRRPTVMRCLYLRSDVVTIDDGIRVISTDPLLRELLSHTVRRCPLYVDDEAGRSLVDVVAEQLTTAPTAPLHLPRPTDDRCCRLADDLVADPSLTIAEAMAQVPASRRTVERRFLAETGMTLGAWHRRSRILAAIELLSAESSITATAVACGYSTPSSFVAAFGSELGTSPRRFLQP